MKVSVSARGYLLLMQLLVFSGSSLFGFQNADAARASVPSGLTLRGCVLLKAGRFLLVDTATSAVAELRGMSLVEDLGDRATITGRTSAVLASLPGATRVLDVDRVTSVSPGGCLTVAAFIGAETTVPNTPAPEVSLRMNRPSLVHRVTATFLTPIERLR
jgi:hypothetical protein